MSFAASARCNDSVGLEQEQFSYDIAMYYLLILIGWGRSILSCFLHVNIRVVSPIIVLQHIEVPSISKWCLSTGLCLPEDSKFFCIKWGLRKKSLSGSRLQIGSETVMPLYMSNMAVFRWSSKGKLLLRVVKWVRNDLARRLSPFSEEVLIAANAKWPPLFATSRLLAVEWNRGKGKCKRGYIVEARNSLAYWLKWDRAVSQPYSQSVHRVTGLKCSTWLENTYKPHNAEI